MWQPCELLYTCYLLTYLLRYTNRPFGHQSRCTKRLLIRGEAADAGFLHPLTCSFASCRDCSARSKAGPLTRSWRAVESSFRGVDKQVCIQPPTAAVNVTLLAFAADRPAAVDMDRKAAAPAADVPCSNRPISPALGAHSSKRTMGQTDRQTDGRTPYR